VTVAEVDVLIDLARASHRTLFTAWHSRFAAAVPHALEWARQRHIHSLSVRWREDVRDWHPGQRWIWEPGGMGVFDAGINALSIVTQMTPSMLRVCDGTLCLPSNRSTPIAATLRLETSDRAPVDVELDWRTSGEPQWDIDVVTNRGTLRLTHGGARLWLNGAERSPPPASEYSGVYAHFADLLDAGASDVDIAPMRLVIDALARCAARRVDCFDEVH
jgi:predicted dehydrogenase